MNKVHLTKRFSFSSAHRMHSSEFSDEENINMFGKCQNIHGHNYQLEVTVSGSVDNKKGYFVNLHELSELIQSNVIGLIDHQYLNEILPGEKDKPVTLEVVSAWIWETANKKLPQYNFEKIRLWETPDNSVEIYK